MTNGNIQLVFDIHVVLGILAKHQALLSFHQFLCLGLLHQLFKLNHPMLLLNETCILTPSLVIVRLHQSELVLQLLQGHASQVSLGEQLSLLHLRLHLLEELREVKFFVATSLNGAVQEIYAHGGEVVLAGVVNVRQESIVGKIRFLTGFARLRLHLNSK